jgi:uncharacterized damage-inducible protein DinB
MPRPQKGDYNNFYQAYVDNAIGNDVQEVIANHSIAINDFVNSLPEAKAAYQYAPEKWTVKDVLQHMIDAERIFVYRALTFARKDGTPLPGFEENDYAANADTSVRSLQSLKDEFIATRNSTDIFLSNLTDEELKQEGSANNNPITVNAIAFIIIGHILHHKRVLEERYL